MLRNKIYYRLKPFIPSLLRMAMRKKFATWKRKRTRDVWPIMPSSEQPPENWNGWPDNKKFAFVLTHDVEGPIGLQKCRQLMQLEKKLGMHSSFNFIPEGSYRVSRELREELTSNGFEVGVHDFQHDGHLFASHREFVRKALHINHYINEWDAAGFRSGFMLHKLDWLHELEIKYDMSTFDTDPFEPQPEGRNTVFPFWVPRPNTFISQSSSRNGARAGYLELPYTLPQDSTLFLLLAEQTAEIWLRKLDWIAEHGGMALVNIHPDYIDFSSSTGSRNTYPVSRILALLDYVLQRYSGAFWNPCPKELVSWFTNTNRLPAKRHLIADTARAERDGEASLTLQGKKAAVLLYSYYPADPRPRRAAEALVEAGMEVDLVCLKENAGEPQQETARGVRVLRTPMRKTRGNKPTYLIQYGRFFLVCFGFLLRRSFRVRYDVVHVHNMPDLLVFAAVIPKLLGAKIILDLHDPMPELMMSIYDFKSNYWPVRLLRKLERWSIGYANLAITPNIAFKKLFVSRSCHKEKIQIVMNSPQQEIFDPDRFGPQGKTSANDQFRIMHHGSIVHRHGIDLLVEALAQVRAVVPDVRLDIYGSATPFLDTVMNLAERLAVADIVHHHGAKPQNEIAEAIRECDLGVVPNRRSAFTEINFPTRLFEYLSMHRPVLAPATQGIRDYFDSEQLITFEPDNVGDLVAKILWVRDNPQKAQDFVERGIEVYRRNLWQGEKGRFLSHISKLHLSET